MCVRARHHNTEYIKFLLNKHIYLSCNNLSFFPQCCSPFFLSALNCLIPCLLHVFCLGKDVRDKRWASVYGSASPSVNCPWGLCGHKLTWVEHGKASSFQFSLGDIQHFVYFGENKCFLCQMNEVPVYREKCVSLCSVCVKCLTTTEVSTLCLMCLKEPLCFRAWVLFFILHYTSFALIMFITCVCHIPMSCKTM